MHACFVQAYGLQLYMRNDCNANVGSAGIMVSAGKGIMRRYRVKVSCAGIVGVCNAKVSWQRLRQKGSDNRYLSAVMWYPNGTADPAER